MHKPKNPVPVPVPTAAKEPPEASEPKESEPITIKKQGGKGARREPIVSNLSKERVESDLSSENEGPKATEVMIFKETEKIINCLAPDCKHRDVTEWGLRRHWMVSGYFLEFFQRIMRFHCSNIYKTITLETSKWYFPLPLAFPKASRPVYPLHQDLDF